jgi:hypothetical protein
MTKHLSTLTCLFAENENVAGSGTRKRKRKSPSAPLVTSENIVEQPSTADVIQIKRPKDAPVELKVQSVKDVMRSSDVSEAEEPIRSEPPFASGSFLQNFRQASASPATKTSLSSTSKENDSLKQLLIDAQQMQSTQQSSDSSAASETNPIKSILSTIVTIDFFVVCGFLLWFLAGIFCSSVLKDDAVQIAFNSNFQAFVQPALGVLMIASIASAVVGNDDQENNQ